MVETIKPINKREIIEKGEKIYKEIESKILPEHKGEVIVIDVDSGDYFFGRNAAEATKKARQKYPHKIFMPPRWVIKP